jgi:hypothetical protein
LSRVTPPSTPIRMAAFPIRSLVFVTRSGVAALNTTHEVIRRPVRGSKTSVITHLAERITELPSGLCLFVCCT